MFTHFTGDLSRNFLDLSLFPLKIWFNSFNLTLTLLNVCINFQYGTDKNGDKSEGGKVSVKLASDKNTDKHIKPSSKINQFVIQGACVMG